MRNVLADLCVESEAATIFEQLMMEEDRAQAIAETQRRVLAASNGADRAANAFRFGVRWATRHQNHEIGAGIQLGPNVFHMFEILGLTEGMSALAVFPENLIMMDSVTGIEVTRIPLLHEFRKKFRYPYAVIHRADLHRVLLDACRRSREIKLVTSQKVVRIEEPTSTAFLPIEIPVPQ